MLSRSYTTSRPFLLHMNPPADRLGVNKKWEGNTAGTADPNWPKKYSIPCDVILSLITIMDDGALLSCK